MRWDRLAILLLVIVGISFVFWHDYFGIRVAHGVVVDRRTGAPVESVRVQVVVLGWKRVEGEWVWNHAYISEMITDSTGQFRLKYRKRLGADLVAEKSGYQRFTRGLAGIPPLYQRNFGEIRLQSEPRRPR